MYYTLTYFEIIDSKLLKYLYIVIEVMDMAQMPTNQNIVPGEIGDENWFWVDVDKIFSNRFNPNRMSKDKADLLEEVVKARKNDPITISPMNIFYSQRVINSQALQESIGDSVNPLNVFIICDGQHRHEKAIRLGIETIKAHVWRITETQAMRYFHPRQTIHGENDPFKEGKMFKHEKKQNGLSDKEIVEAYCLSNTQYVTLRMQLVDEISNRVIDLFRESFDDKDRWPGTLTTSHLGVIKGLSKKYQELVALGILENHWSVATTIAIVKKIKLAQKERKSIDLNQLTKEQIFPHIFNKDIDVSSLPPLDDLMRGYSMTFFNEILPKLREASISPKSTAGLKSPSIKQEFPSAFEGRLIEVEANNFLDSLIILNIIDDSSYDTSAEELLKNLKKNMRIATEDPSVMNLLLAAFGAMQVYLRKRGA